MELLNLDRKDSQGSMRSVEASRLIYSSINNNSMGIIAWVIFGAIAGWIASLVMGSSDSLVTDIVLGIVGAVLGGWLVGFFGYSGVSGFNVYSFLVAVLGAVVLIAIVRAIR